MIETARSQVSSQKGGRPGAMLDPRRASAPIRQIRRSKWTLGLIPPADDQNMLAKLYRETVEALPAAAAAERARRVAWLGEMEEAFGEGASRSMIVMTIVAARDAAVLAGVGTQTSLRPLSDALERSRRSNMMRRLPPSVDWRGRQSDRRASRIWSWSRQRSRGWEFSARRGGGVF